MLSYLNGLIIPAIVIDNNKKGIVTEIGFMHVFFANVKMNISSLFPQSPLSALFVIKAMPFMIHFKSMNTAK